MNHRRQDPLPHHAAFGTGFIVSNRTRISPSGVFCTTTVRATFFQAALAEFLEAGDREPVDLVALRLEPVARLAAAVGTRQHAAFGARAARCFPALHRWRRDAREMP